MRLMLNFIKAMKLCRMGYKVKCKKWDKEKFIYADSRGFLYKGWDKELYSPHLDDILEMEWEVFKG